MQSRPRLVGAFFALELGWGRLVAAPPPRVLLRGLRGLQTDLSFLCVQEEPPPSLRACPFGGPLSPPLFGGCT